MIILSALAAALLSAPARAAETPAPAPAAAPARSTAPVAAASVSVLTERFLETAKDSEKTEILKRMAKTTPVSGQDVSNLFDLFSRYSDPFTRASIMESLGRLGQGNPQLEPLFITYLRQPEPDAQLFGINGAFRLRARAALPLIKAIAERKFTASKVTETNMSERNAWWAQYEALSVLAQWEGDKVYPLIASKGLESAKVGTLLGRYYWKQTLPQLKGWAASGDLIASERAALAVGAPIDLADARATRAPMLELLRDPKADAEIRHQIALKVGLSSNDEEAAALVKEHDAAPSDNDRLYWATAAFVTRSAKVVPLLVRYAVQTKDETMQKGATAQLKDMLGDAEAQALIDLEKKK